MGDAKLKKVNGAAKKQFTKDQKLELHALRVAWFSLKQEIERVIHEQNGRLNELDNKFKAKLSEHIKTQEIDLATCALNIDTLEIVERPQS